MKQAVPKGRPVIFLPIHAHVLEASYQEALIAQNISNSVSAVIKLKSNESWADVGADYRSDFYWLRPDTREFFFQ